MTCCCLWCCCCWLHCFYCCLPVTGAKKHNTEWLPTLPTDVKPQPSRDRSTKTGNTLRNPPPCPGTVFRDPQGDRLHQQLSVLQSSSLRLHFLNSLICVWRQTINCVFTAAVHNKSLYVNNQPNFWRVKVSISSFVNDQSRSLHAVKGPDIYFVFTEANTCARGKVQLFYLIKTRNSYSFSSVFSCTD